MAPLGRRQIARSFFGPHEGRSVPTEPVVVGTPRHGTAGAWGTDYSMCRPEMARLMTRRWISEVPSKMV